MHHFLPKSRKQLHSLSDISILCQIEIGIKIMNDSRSRTSYTLRRGRGRKQLHKSFQKGKEKKELGKLIF